MLTNGVVHHLGEPRPRQALGQHGTFYRDSQHIVDKLGVFARG